MNRLAQPSDLERVFAIAMHERVLRYLDFEPMDRPAFSAVFDALVRSGCFFVHEHDGAVAGFCKVTRGGVHTSHVAYVSLLAIDPVHVGKGIAQRMLAAAIEQQRAAGARRVELTVESTNSRALAFYRKLGFEIEGRLRQSYRTPSGGYVDDFVMGLLLAPA
jgi:putative acetyltransferase